MLEEVKQKEAALKQAESGIVQAQAGVKVADVKELLQKLKNEAGVL